MLPLPPLSGGTVALYVCAGGALFLASFIWLKCFHNQLRFGAYYRKQGIVGKPFKPFIGNILDLNKIRHGPNPHVELWRDIVRSESLISYYHLGPEFRLCIMDLDVVKGILVTHAQCFRKPLLMTTMLGELLGDGLVLAEGAVHRRHRAMINPAFHFHKLRLMSNLMGQAAHKCMTRWLDDMRAGRSTPASAALAEGGGHHGTPIAPSALAPGADPAAVKALADAGFTYRVDMHHEMSAVTLDIIGEWWPLA